MNVEQLTTTSLLVRLFGGARVPADPKQQDALLNFTFQSFITYGTASGQAETYVEIDDTCSTTLSSVDTDTENWDMSVLPGPFGDVGLGSVRLMLLQNNSTNDILFGGDDSAFIGTVSGSGALQKVIPAGGVDLLFAPAGVDCVTKNLLRLRTASGQAAYSLWILGTRL